MEKSTSNMGRIQTDVTRRSRFYMIPKYCKKYSISGKNIGPKISDKTCKTPIRW